MGRSTPKNGPTYTRMAPPIYRTAASQIRAALMLDVHRKQPDIGVWITVRIAQACVRYSR